MRIFINPGHCPGIDSGAVNHILGITEADTVLEIGNLLKGYLENAGFEVKLLQSDNLNYDGVGECVVESANSYADLFISLHCNAFNTEAKGTETCVYSLYGAGAKLGQCIQNQLVSTIGTVDRGLKERTGLVVLNSTLMPAVLVEIAFIDNMDDANILVNKKDDIARAIARGVTDYLQ